MFVQVSHDASSCKLVTTFVRASQPQQLLLSVFVHVSHDVCSWMLVTTPSLEWFVHLDVASFLSSPDLPERSIGSCDVEKAEIRSSASSTVAVSIVAGFTWEVDRFMRRWEGGNQVLGIFFGSYASYYFVVRERFLEAVGGTRFLQAVRDIILQEVREWFFDTTRGARVILWSYERCESDSSRLRVILEWFLEATKEEEATRWLEKVDNKVERDMPYDLQWSRLIADLMEYDTW